MKKGFNWKSIIPLVLALTAPLYAPKLAAVGVQVGPAFALPFLFAFPLAWGGGLFPLIQAIGNLVAGLTAHGAFSIGASDWKTNIAGVAGAFFVLLSAFGLHVAPETQAAIGGVASALILFFSASPDTEIFTGE